MRSVSLIALVLLLFAAPCLAARPAIPQGADTPKMKVYIVRQDVELLYSCGALDCPVIGQVERGERMAILETVGYFYRVRGLTSGKEGWVNTKPYQPRPNHAIVTARALNMRSCPSLKCQVLTVLPKGERLRVIKVDGNWTRVEREPNGLKGWVYNRYIRYY